MAGLRAHDKVDVVAPLGRPFPIPTEPVACVLVGGGYGSAPLFWLADVLRGEGYAVLEARSREHAIQLTARFLRVL